MKEMNKLEDIGDSFPYLDILYLEHPTSKRHPRLPSYARAAQFSPYAALTGYGDQVKETYRLTTEKIVLTDDEKEKLDEKILHIIKNLDKSKIEVTYFVKDNKKSGGCYKTKKGIVRRIDTYNQVLIFNDKEKIAISDIVNIDTINDKIE